MFPLGLSDPPPVDGTAPNGKRNYTVWTETGLAEQLIAVGRELDTAVQHGLQLWAALAGVDDDLSRKPLLDEIVEALAPHPGLGVWKGADELRTATSHRQG